MAIDWALRDPEEVGPEHPDDLDLRMRVVEARHVFVADADGKCAELAARFCYEHKVTDYHNRCGAEESSVMHIDDFRDQHDHGGGDCMCFEGRDYE